MLTDRFCQGKPHKSNINEALYDRDRKDLHKYFGGDWKGITIKINEGYFAELGITTLLISQPVENILSFNDQRQTSYHGYWPRDFFKTNPFYGDFNDFDELITTAHQNSLKIFIDFTANHTSPANPENVDLAENGSLYKNEQKLGSLSNDALGIFNHYGGSDFTTLENCIYKNLFDLADLNQLNPIVDQYLRDAIKFWLEKGIDGIRLDAARHMPLGWQKSFLNHIYNIKPVFVFGEWYLYNNQYCKNYVKFANESGMSFLDFNFAHKIREIFRNHTENFHHFQEMITTSERQLNICNIQMTFIDNHDMDRFLLDKEDTLPLEQSLVLLLTSRGIPIIYYGTEQYMIGNGDPQNRQMMNNFDRNTKAFNIIKKLSELRRNNNALAYGKTRFLYVNANVLIFERNFQNNVVLVAINNSKEEITFNFNFSTLLPNNQVYRDVLQGCLNSNMRLSVNNDGFFQLTVKPSSAGVWSYKSDDPHHIEISLIWPEFLNAGMIAKVNGVNFLNKPGKVLIQEQEAKIISWNDCQIEFETPSFIKTRGFEDIFIENINGDKNKINVFIHEDKQICVRVILENAPCRSGENIYIVGNIPSLGSWNPLKAVGPFFNEIIAKYPNWGLDINLPQNQTIEFKFVKIFDDDHIVWESGKNHVIQTFFENVGEIQVKAQF